VVSVRSTRTNERVVRDMVDSLASPMQARQPREEAEERSLMTVQDNRLVEMKEWTTPGASDRSSRSFFVKGDMD
jgi:hypothetical protein